MRLPPVPPDQMNNSQRELYDRNVEQIGREFTVFKTTAEDGTLLGPWGVFIHEPDVGQAHYDVIDSLSSLKRLPEAAKQVALMVVGAHYRAAYELYAHAAVASSQGIGENKIATICSGNRPPDLTPDEACAYDVAAALSGGGVLPGATYTDAVEQFGQQAFNELALWIATYAFVSLTLNAFDVQSEESFDAETAQ